MFYRKSTSGHASARDSSQLNSAIPSAKKFNRFVSVMSTRRKQGFSLPSVLHKL